MSFLELQGKENRSGLDVNSRSKAEPVLSALVAFLPEIPLVTLMTWSHLLLGY